MNQIVLSNEKMTYQELLERLQKLNKEQLTQDVVICDVNDEFFKVQGLYYSNEEFIDALDHGHPFLNVSNSTSAIY